VRFLDNGGRPVVVDLDSGRWGGALDPGAARVPLRQEEVRFPARGAVLAGTLTLPRGPGPFPAAVYVHGSGRAGRDFAQHVGVLLAFRGIALLAYDKRGVGQSTGSYPGERATPAALATLTGDAEAAVRFLAAQPEVDRSRLGLYGLSQGGWIVPRAAAELAGTVSWALILSGPLVSQGEADDFESLAQGAPDAELPALEAQAHASGPSGFDPAPWVRRLRIPVLWLYGGRDHNQPGGSSLAILETIRSETGVDLQWRRFPTADHGLFDTDPGPRRHPAELFPALTAWLVAKGLAST
jgi:dienelactone hydrolase